MQAIGNTLYTTHYEWLSEPVPGAPGNTISWARYYLDKIDLSDRAHPRIGQSMNVPGTLVGASSKDPSVLYFADYNWDGENENDAIAACKVDGGKCYLQSYTKLDGYVGNVIVQNDKAYMTVQEYDWMWQDGSGGAADAVRRAPPAQSDEPARAGRPRLHQPERRVGLAARGAGRPRDRHLGLGPRRRRHLQAERHRGAGVRSDGPHARLGQQRHHPAGQHAVPVERVLGRAADRPAVARSNAKRQEGRRPHYV